MKQKPRHRPHPVPNGNRHQRDAKLRNIDREGQRSFTAQESRNKYRYERIAEGGYK